MSAGDGNFGAVATACRMLGSGDDRVQKPGQRSESRGVRTGFKGTAILLSGAPTSFVAPLAFLLHDEEEEDPAQILCQLKARNRFHLKQQRNSARNATTARARSGSQPRSSTRPNNVAADQNGNLTQRSQSSNWESCAGSKPSSSTSRSLDRFRTRGASASWDGPCSIHTTWSRAEVKMVKYQ